MNARAVAVEVVRSVVDEGRHIDAALSDHAASLDPSARSFAAAISFATIRRWWLIEAYLERHLKRPFNKKGRYLHFVIAIGLAQLDQGRTASHAAVNETVSLASGQWKWARGLVNAVLRGFQRKDTALGLEDSPERAHPDWLAAMIEADWPSQANSIMAANMCEPPLWIRINESSVTVEQWRSKLAAGVSATPSEALSCALRIEPAIDVSQLPGFDVADCSVQDGAAQWAATLLQCEPGMRVLDACAAPGGKTLHLLQQTPSLDVVALDRDGGRLERVSENLRRGSLTAKCITGDATETKWWDNKPFDRILLDAPCTATGVIRRHPEILVNRSRRQVEEAVAQQSQLLDQLWTLLKPGGQLLYATCSVLKCENEHQISSFLGRTPSAQERPLPGNVGLPTTYGHQILTGNVNGFDGFYYALLGKKDD